MKNLLLTLFFFAAVVGCGVAYMLLRMPNHEVTVLIVRYLQVKPDGEAVEVAVPVPETDPVADAAASSPASSGGSAKVVGQATEEWCGFTSDNWYAGRKLSAKDFRNKVVLVYEWSAAEKPSVQMLARIEELWSGFKYKPFLVVGSHRGGRNPWIPNAYRKLRLTFPMYEGAGFHKEPEVASYPYFYVVDHHGRIVYRGRDDHAVSEILVTAVTAAQLGAEP